MATITKIKPGQMLYDVARNTGFDAFRNKWKVWPVAVDEVNIEEAISLLAGTSSTRREEWESMLSKSSG